MASCELIPEDPVGEAISAVLLSLYVVAIVFPMSSLLYGILVGRGLGEHRSRYFTRKFIHIAAGGVAALATPLLFSTPLTPLALSTAMASLLLARHALGRAHWFQESNNLYDVNFNLAWGWSIAGLWCLTANPWLAVLPALFISFGDGVTGIVRNMVHARRTKHWTGNLAMVLVAAPLGYALGGWVGLVAGIVSSTVERLEAGPIDDNIIIAATSSAIIYLGTLMSDTALFIWSLPWG